MRTIIAGSRDITNYDLVLNAVSEAMDIGINPTHILSGGAKGVDELAIWYAEDNNLPYEIHNAEWTKYGKGAGIIRNHKMGDIADALIAVWDGKSSGTKDMIEYAKYKKLKTFVYRID